MHMFTNVSVGLCSGGSRGRGVGGWTSFPPFSLGNFAKIGKNNTFNKFRGWTTLIKGRIPPPRFQKFLDPPLPMNNFNKCTLRVCYCTTFIDI